MIAKKALLALGLCAIAAGACSDGFGKPRGFRRLTIELKDADKVTGSRLAPRPLLIDQPERFKIIVRSVLADGTPDTAFTGYVRISAKPGAIERLDGPGTDGRNVLLTNGESPEVEVPLTNAYGTTYILADDLGYNPVSALDQPPPGCANGVDDDLDGRIDFPADEGCAFANDDSELGSSYAQGASAPIFYALPRIADIRGLRCGAVCSGSGATPYPKEQIQIDTGLHDQPDGSQRFDFDVVVTRISSDGFYTNDVKDARGGFNGIFAFNFNAPPRMRVCDRMKTFGGTANEFFGFTQVSYPTWTLEEWDPARRRCLVPDARVLVPAEAGDVNVLLPLSGSLVRAVSTADKTLSLKVTPKFGPGNTKKQGDVYVPSDDATNCDFNDDGRVDFAAGSEEAKCADACTKDPECTEFSNFKARSTFRLTLTDANKISGAVQADATASAGFDPLAMKGKELRSFTGTLHFFSGGSQYTIEARCRDDIVVDLNQTPLGADKVCANNNECPNGFECTTLQSGEKACRTPDTKAPPPLACVFPRTILENNPQ